MKVPRELIEGRKDDQEKNALELISPTFIFALGEVLTYGKQKYGARNWEQGMHWSRCFGAALRHLFAWWRGDKGDPDTQLSHLAHAACCIMFLVHYETKGVGTDDRSR